MNRLPHKRDFTGELREQSRKMTAPRRAILDAMEAETHPLTSKELFALLPKGICDLATVYRSMHLLEKLGLVKRFDFGDAVARYELLHHEEQGHHHHLICTGCSTVVEIEECFPEELERKIATGNGFKGITHKLEFFGICPECQTK